MVRILSVLLISVVFCGNIAFAKGKNNQNLVVVELFTSQGCNSCPPADDILAEISKRSDILALSYSVDYWNYLGWEDTLAQPDCTIRQRKYNKSLGKSGVYTPQMIIQGRRDVIGSRGAAVEKLVSQAPGLGDIDLTFQLSDQMIDLRIAARDKAGTATIWIIGFDDEETVMIKRGELHGQTRKYHNVVRAIKRIGSWMGEEVKLTLSKADISNGEYDAYALLLQQDETGPIIAAARLTE